MRTKKFRVRSTTEVLEVLRAVNPAAELTEYSIRGVIRRGLIDRPSTLGGAYVWSNSEVEALAKSLGLNAPSVEESHG